jgi:hypothetical protein
MAVRAEIGFVSPRPFACPIRHNSFSHRVLALRVAREELALFGALAPSGSSSCGLASRRPSPSVRGKLALFGANALCLRGRSLTSPYGRTIIRVPKRDPFAMGARASADETLRSYGRISMLRHSVARLSYGCTISLSSKIPVRLTGTDRHRIPAPPVFQQGFLPRSVGPSKIALGGSPVRASRERIRGWTMAGR